MSEERRLWAPWRNAYIRMKKSQRCIFCIGTRAGDRKMRVIARGEHAFSMLNKYPYNCGHVMVAPYRHAGDIALLTDDELSDMMRLLVETKRLLDRTLKPHAYNIGMNLGKIAGAGFDAHVHIHIVPRWASDTNFMPVVADTRVLSDSLDALYERLKKEAKKARRFGAGSSEFGVSRLNA